MAYFDDYKKKHMTRSEHLRADADKPDEGREYRGARKNFRNNDRMDGYHKDERGGYRGAGKFGDKKSSFGESRSYGDRKGSFGSYGEKKNGYGEHMTRKPYGEQSRGDKKPFNKDGERRSFRPAGERTEFRKPAPAPRREVEAFVPVEEPVENNILTGRNPIREALKSGHDIEKLMVAKGDLSGTAREIVAMAREQKVPVQMVERTRLDEIAKNHQGMIAFASAYQYAQVDEMLELAEEKGEDPFLIILDGVTDPHNLGAVIRTAAAVGAHGVIVPERRAVGLTPAAVKASAGGVEHIKVARVTNLTNEIKKLKSHGIWLYAAAADGESFRGVSFEGPCALVIGSEGDGISRLVKEQCDYVVSIPMKNPEMESLNASVAAGILMYAAAAVRE